MPAPISARRVIAAPKDDVFEIVSDVRNFQKAVPAIIKIEFLTEQQHGVGTRFRETRRMGKREASVELEVTEFEPGEHVRIVSDAGGTVWDSLFTVSDVGSAEEPQTELVLTMEMRPHNLLARMSLPLIRKMVVRGLEADMDSVKEYCEAQVSDA